jgi:hypothetical protein
MKYGSCEICPEANGAAHELARAGFFINDLYWIDEPPNFIFYKLVNDVTLN